MLTSWDFSLNGGSLNVSVITPVTNIKTPDIINGR
jgi:hypothetical protein